MPLLPYLSPTKAKAQMQDKFAGLWMRESADPGQFVEMLNMSSDEYPYLAPRHKRRYVRQFEHCTALLGGECLSWVDGGRLYYDGKDVCDVTSERPQLIRMGAYIVVWPDKVIYNTHTGEVTHMDAEWSNETADGNITINVRPCTLTGIEYAYTASDTAPANPGQNEYWYNTLTGGFYQYLGTEWQGIETVYSRIEGPDLGKMFKDYDVVSISGFSYDEYNMEAATIYARGDDYIVVATGTVRDFDELGVISIKRAAPAMDYICENGNRLWGCSSERHEIYGCKLGDPTNWHSFLGISTDSYAATIGSEGEFTGIISYLGYVHFFKEDRCHRLYGTRPENYQLMELPIRGVKAGCDRSLTIVNGIVYYVSRDNVMAYDGASPVSVGDALGDRHISKAVAGAHGDKIYLSALLEGEENWRLYVMDTRRGLWHQEDFTQLTACASTPEGDFMTDGSCLALIDGGQSEYEDAAYADDEGPFFWSAVTGDNGQDSPNEKWIRRITLRVKAERGARLQVDIMYDSDGRWHRALNYEAKGKRTETLKIRAMRCDHYKLRYTGSGRVLVLSAAKTYDESSERSGKA